MFENVHYGILFYQKFFRIDYPFKKFDCIFCPVLWNIQDVSLIINYI